MMIKPQRDIWRDNDLSPTYLMNKDGQLTCMNSYDVQKCLNEHIEKSGKSIKLEPGQFISEKIGSSYESWKPGDIHFLNVACGKGKTTFIMKSLSYFLDQGYKIIFLANRKILLSQIIQYVLKGLSIVEYNWIPLEKLCDTVKDIDERVFFSTYQALGDIYKSGKEFLSEKFRNENVVLVMDEVHYFTSDCLFSTAPEYVLDGLMKQFSDSIMIMMSATAQDIFPVIARYRPYLPDRQVTVPPCPRFSPFPVSWSGVVCGNLNPTAWSCQQCNPQAQLLASQGLLADTIPGVKPIASYYYDDGFDTTKVSPYSFENDDQLLSKISVSLSDEKWLVFTGSKERGQKLMCTLAEAGIQAEFIYSPTDGEELSENASAEKSSILTDEQFKAKVLIATAVLDCGTTIHDKKVTNVVIDSMDPITSIQFVGRIRKDGQHMNLYFRSRTSKQVEDYLYQRIRQPLQDMRILDRSPYERDHNEELVGKFLGKLLTIEKCIIRKNRLAEIKLRNLQIYYAHIVVESSIYGDDSFLVHQLELFGFDTSECKSIDYCEKEEQHKAICSLIQTKLDYQMDEEEYNKFCQALDETIIIAFGSASIRRGHTHKSDTYNQLFAKNNIPYRLSYDTEDNKYTFSAISAEKSA